MLAEDLFIRGNQAEFATWMLIALVFAYFAYKNSGPARKRCLIAAAIFFVFAISDLVEIGTGAWWKPWWLAVWKGGCVLGLAILLVDDFRRRRRPPPESDHG
jgi:hypothetical protein